VGQVDYLAQWSEPDVGVVVNAGVAHLGVVGSLDAIAQGKSEIWGRLRRGGTAVLPAGDQRLLGRAPQRRITFGTEAGADVRVVDVTPRGVSGSDVLFEARGRPLEGRVPLVGRHNVLNAACALAVAVALDLDLDVAARNLAGARPARQRSEVATIAGRHVLVDCYNANPTSMKAALETLVELAAGRTAVAVIGDMLELGEAETAEHEAIGALAARLGLQRLVAIGPRAAHAARAAAGVPHVLATQDVLEAARTAAAWTAPGDWILVKASRGMRLERVVAALSEAA